MEENKLVSSIAEDEEQSLQRFTAIRELLEASKRYLETVHGECFEIIEHDGWKTLEFYITYGDYSIHGKVDNLKCHLDFDVWEDGVLLSGSSQRIYYSASTPPVHYFLIEAFCAMVRALDGVGHPMDDGFSEILKFSKVQK